MTSPLTEIDVQCPKCGTKYKDWYRASMNLGLDDFDEEYVRSASTATCPSCGTVVELSRLIVEKDGTWKARQ
jgi:endogenous inhibitor of DNA gyrase (YacG/DUF329 family)